MKIDVRPDKRWLIKLGVYTNPQTIQFWFRKVFEMFTGKCKATKNGPCKLVVFNSHVPLCYDFYKNIFFCSRTMKNGLGKRAMSWEVVNFWVKRKQSSANTTNLIALALNSQMNNELFRSSIVCLAPDTFCNKKI